MTEIPTIAFERRKGLDPKGNARMRVVVTIKLPSGDYHCGEAFTPHVALLFAVTHWVNHELRKEQ